MERHPLLASVPVRMLDNIRNFSLPQKEILKLCVEALERREQGGFNNASSYNFHKDTWAKTIVGAVGLLNNSPLDVRSDCWFAAPARGKENGYPHINVYLVDSRDRDANSTVRTQSKQLEPQLWRKMSKVFHALFYPDKYIGEEHEALILRHRCHHIPQRCWNPFHCVLGTHTENKSDDGCINGAGFLCPHMPPCVFSDDHGIIIPCRNMSVPANDKQPPLCGHVLDCWERKCYLHCDDFVERNQQIRQKKRKFKDL